MGKENWRISILVDATNEESADLKAEKITQSNLRGYLDPESSADQTDQVQVVKMKENWDKKY